MDTYQQYVSITANQKVYISIICTLFATLRKWLEFYEIYAPFTGRRRDHVVRGCEAVYATYQSIAPVP